MQREEKETLFLIVDLFCGAGGTTTGFVMGGGIAKVIACVNHDPEAIKSHWINHPEVHHFEEDIRTLDLTGLKAICEFHKTKYPDAKLILWASLECTNFSKAKGGQPRDADSRTLADHLDRYVLVLNPDYIQIENVVEFMSWGPLDENGKPLSKKNGSDWMRWRKHICSHGYVDDWKELNSANYGAYTSRNRLFGCFAKDGLPIAWPEATHAKNPNKGTMYGAPLEKWKAVKEVLDFEDEGNSIFDRKKPLSEKTLERIYAGLIKYIAGGKTSFLAKYYSGRPAGKVISTEGPAGVITTAGTQSLIQTKFLLKYNSTDNKGNHNPPSINEPCPVIATQNRLGLIQTNFLHAYYGNGDNNHSVDGPAPTIPTKDRLILIKPCHFIDRNFTGNHNHSSVESPAGSILSNPKLNLIQADRAFVMNTNFDNSPTSIETPHPVITANRKWSYLVNPSWSGNGSNPRSIDEPAPVIIARQDKAPLYLVVSTEGDIAIRMEDNDSECTIKIKEFMVLYGIIDIKMRMLKIRELTKIQGFPNDYKLTGTQTDQKKFIGNSVVPQVVTAWVLAMSESINNSNKKVA